MRSLVTFLALLVAFPLLAQPLITSRRDSPVILVYKLTDDQTRSLMKGANKFPESLFSSPYGSYSADSVLQSEQFPVGHYLFVKSENEKLVIWLESNNNVSLQVLNNQRDLVMTFAGEDSGVVRPDQVAVDGKTIHFDPATATFRKSREKSGGLVEVRFEGHTSFFLLEHDPKSPSFEMIGRRILYTFPINLVTNSIRYLYRNIPSLIRYGDMEKPGIAVRVSRLFTPQFSGYMVTNKPLYRPGDTVRIKGIVTKKGRIYHRPLDLSLTGVTRSISLGRIHPTPNGSYLHELILADSLKLPLDSFYGLSMGHPGHTFISGHFKLEEYELTSNQFKVKSINHDPSRPAKLILSGTDDNGMPLYDVTVSITLLTDPPRDFEGDSLHLPQKIWWHTMPLEATGETTLELPDSIFQAADFAYHADVVFLDARNERHEFRKDLNHIYDPFPVSVELTGGDLVVTGNPVSQPVRLSITNSTGASREISGVLPINIPVTANDVEVTCRLRDRKKTWTLQEFDPVIGFNGERTTDSLIFTATSPAPVTFHYYLFKNRRLVKYGTDSTINLRSRASYHDDYSVSIQYVWGGKPVAREFSLPLRRSDLTIQAVHKELVAPGISDHIDIKVTDKRGKPAPGVNLTAWAVTGKFGFNDKAVDLPDFGRPFHSRKSLGTFSTTNMPVKIQERLEWEEWKNKLEINRIPYYRFIFPEEGMFKELQRAACSTVLPFVVDSLGRVLPVHYLYVDDELIYARSTDHDQPYAFSVKPGYRTFTMRGADFRLELPPMYIHDSTRLIFSVNKDYPAYRERLTLQSGILTKEEIRKIKYQFIQIDKAPGSDYQIFSQGNRLYPLPPGRFSGVIGPFQTGLLSIKDGKGPGQSLLYEPFYRYEYSPRLLRLHDWSTNHFLDRWMSSQPISPVFTGQPWTAKNLESSRFLRKRTFINHSKYPHAEQDEETGRILVAFSDPSAAVELYFIYNLDHPDNYYIINHQQPGLYEFPAGPYELVALNRDSTYFRFHNAMVRSGNWNKFRFDSTRHPADHFSRTILNRIEVWASEENYINTERNREYQQIREEFIDTNRLNPYTNVVSGYITDLEGEPLPGVNVILRGTTFGTVSDLNGFYRINAPLNGRLVYSFVGMVTREMAINNAATMDVELQEDVTQLSEVVVTGYGSSQVMHLTSSLSVTSALNGRVSGLALGSSPQVQLRGVGSLSSTARPLILVDGVLVNTLDDIELSTIAVSLVLKGEEAMALYGSQAANGVILISTNSGISVEELKRDSKNVLAMAIPAQSTGHSLRHNFKDYALWAPDLQTDKQGRAAVDISYPDDITSWKLHILGLGKKSSGSMVHTVRSFKPLQAEVLAPRFLIRGDSVKVIGRITNYTNDSIPIMRGFGEWTATRIGHSLIDERWVSPATSDSLELIYKVKKDDYEDGEIRILPVLRQGIEETTGSFITLDSDTVLTLDRPADQWKIVLNSNLLDVMMSESEYLAHYVHGCNEQMASRLSGLLSKQKIMKYRGQKTHRQENEIRSLIKKLTANQLSAGAWAWWGNEGEPSPWVTIHIARVLQDARESGFPVAMDDIGAGNYLSGRLESMEGTLLYHALEWLVSADHRVLLDSFPGLSSRQDTTLTAVLWHTRLKQLQGEPVDLSFLRRYRHQTLYKNSFYGNITSEGLVANSLQTTLMVYRILETANKNDGELARIRGFLLEKRGVHWRNTYESSTILTTILNGLISKGEEYEPIRVTVNDQPVNSFPYVLHAADDQVQVKKSGTGTVYLGSMAMHWDPVPEAVDSLFLVITSFSDSLKEGTPVTMQVDLTVKKSGEYMMLTVPVPSGTRYANKMEYKGPNVVHREYFTDRVCLYFESLPVGRFSYEISLIPAFTGRYIVNPAKVESMYFPVFYGRNGMGKLGITSE